VAPGTIILVKPGERIPLDGVVVEGGSYVDEAIVTGESIPVFKKRHDEVYGSTLNVSGVLEIKVTKHPKDTLVSKIVKLVLEARSRKADMEKLIERFSKYYVPIVILAALSTAIIPTLYGGAPRTWIYRSLILLVIACPSAFIISVPATFFSAITYSARKGIIIKGGVYVEEMSRIKTAIFDKTGTLTLGTPTILSDCKNAYIRDENVIAYAAAVERYSNHPIAKAIIRKAKEEKINLEDFRVENITEIPGKGMIADVNGRTIAVGGIEMLEESKIVLDRGQIDSDPHTKVFVIIEKSLAAKLCLSDQIRIDAVKAINKLKSMGIYTVILSGDKKEVTEEIARKLGVDEYHAELLPEDKLELVKQYQEKGEKVAMIGDGINDAPALASSDVGIAMSDIGADVALESADIVLVKNELTDIPYLFRLSGKTMDIARQNIVISLLVKLSLGILGIMGFIPLWFTVAVGDDGVTMFLLLNILRLARIRRS
jgi:Cd2+/Zn2+-exporting ATPase